MPTRTAFVYSLLSIFAATAALADLPDAACDAVSYGAGVKLTATTPLSTILDAPDGFVGQDVRVAGTVKEVCEMRGCWMELEAADAAGRALKIKVKDGEIEFPVSARGKSAVAQGKVEKLEMSRGKYVKHLKHIADEQKRPFDEASVVGEGPFHVYQIAGTGAEICR